MIKSSSRSPRRPRNLRVEQLERRQLLAAHINELMIDPLFTTAAVGQYVEFRGEPNSTIQEGTYFVAVSDSGIGSVNPGVVHAIFDLSGQSFGSTGFLVILPQASPYPVGDGITETNTATFLRSTAPGFGGLPGNLFSNISTLDDSIDTLRSSSFFLFQTDTAPTLGADIDAENDGVIDEESIHSKWNVLDSVSLHHGVFSGPVSYADILYVEENFDDKITNVITQPEATIVRGKGFGYAARVGDSTGSKAADWVFSTARDVSPGTAGVDFELEEGIFGVPIPRFLTGRNLDSLGESNFTAAVRGSAKEQITDATGVTTIVPLEGFSFLADTNGNGKQDLLSYRVEPDDFEAGSRLTNVYPGITLTTTTTNIDATGFHVESEAEFFLAPTGNRVFSHVGIGFFNSSRRLRMDFGRPARSVSVEVIAGSTFTPTYGRLEAFNAEGESLGFVRTRALFGENRERIRLTFGTDKIAYAFAYSDEDYLNSSPFGALDNIQFQQSEALATTDADGEFVLNYLQPDSYDITPLSKSDAIFATDLEITPFEVSRYENLRLDYNLRLNSPPEIDPLSITTREDVRSGVTIGTAKATDRDENQTVAYSLQGESPFTIDSITGNLSVKENSSLDFEAVPVWNVTVVATDSVGGVSTRLVKIEVTDVNEAPVVTLDSYSVSEDADLNSAFGRINAVDPETPDAPSKFTIVSGSGAAAFSIEETTGILRVKDPSKIDFESTKVLKLLVAVSDTSPQALKTQVNVEISVIDANDRPLISTESFSVIESVKVSETVGIVKVVDQDVASTHTFRILNEEDQPFAIDSETGQIRVIDTLDFERKAAYELEVQAVDNGNPPRGSSRKIAINVVNVDEPAKLTRTSFTVAEDAVPETEVGVLEAIDPENKPNIRYASNDPANPTKLFGGRVLIDATTGKLTVAPGATLDADGESSTVTDKIRITSGDALLGNPEVTLNITGVNEAPVLLPQTFGLPEGLPSGRVFAQIQVSDPEQDKVTLSIFGTAEAQFAIDGDGRLLVRPEVTLDFAANPEIKVSVRATDPSGLSSTAVMTIIKAPIPRFGTPIPNQAILTGKTVDFTFPAEYRSPNIKSLSVVTATGSLPAGLRFDPVVGRLSGTPAPSVKGTFPITVRVVEFDGSDEIMKEQQFELVISRSAKPLFNSTITFDVDADGKVTVSDALKVINFIAKKKEGDVFALADEVAFYYDSSGNNSVTSLDALLVINHVGRQIRAGAATGESRSNLVAGVPNQENTKVQDRAITELASENMLF